MSSKSRSQSNSTIKSNLSSYFRKQKYGSYTTNVEDYELLNFAGITNDISQLYHAYHIPSKTYVSIEITSLVSFLPSLLQELIQSAMIKATLKNKHILQSFTSFCSEEDIWSVSKVCEIPCLKNVLDLGLSESKTQRILKDTLKALAYMHGQHLVHADIRAENIVVSTDGVAMLTGLWSVVSLISSGSKQSVYTKLSQGYEHASPELLSQNSTIDQSTDIYSFGILALELITGRTPFTDMPPLKILLYKKSYNVPMMVGLKDKMPPKLFEIVEKCLLRDPRSRPTAQSLLTSEYFTGRFSRNGLRRLGSNSTTPVSIDSVDEA